jgi:hypothetical protein
MGDLVMSSNFTYLNSFQTNNTEQNSRTNNLLRRSYGSLLEQKKGTYDNLLRKRKLRANLVEA